MNELTALADKYGTDKGSLYDGAHKFTDAYYNIFNEQREDIVNIFEVGILNGASAKMWRDYFPNATVYCADINPSFVNNVSNEPRIKAMVLDQNDRDMLVKKFTELDVLYDFIIDDGGHWMHQQQLTFGCLFKFVKPQGHYIIEDLHTSMNTNFWKPHGTNVDTTLEMISRYEVTKKWSSQYIIQDDLKYINEHTTNVEVFGWDNLKNKEKMSITSIITKK